MPAFSSKTWRTILTTAASTIPVAIFFRDRCGSVAHVRGSSMEPTVRNGDWVWVRKRDAPFRRSDEHIIRRYEWLEFGESPSVLLVRPGAVVVVQNPVTLKTASTNKNDGMMIKRVVGVSGQWISHPGVHPAFRFEEMRPYSVFVEGDHRDESIDSRVLGPISKNLVLGVAEYVVWPPSRWGKIETKEVLDEEGRPRAIWSLEDELER